MKPTANFDNWPRVIISTGNGDATDQDVARLVHDYVAGIELRSGPFVVIQDTTTGATLDARQRKLLSQHMEANAEVTSRCIGFALVLGSSLQTHLLTAVLWLRKPRYPVKPFDSFAAAEKWLEGQLERAQVERDAKPR